uniref:Uncharacterized protein n=1 Tax=Setaria viridis TaxID=4556 RepID=A0A4U6TL36_SETVI|nr:hypothetical protein SEVIR_8G196000v2 [Setaria viridis]
MLLSSHSALAAPHDAPISLLCPRASVPCHISARRFHLSSPWVCCHPSSPARATAALPQHKPSTSIVREGYFRQAPWEVRVKLRGPASFGFLRLAHFDDRLRCSFTSEGVLAQSVW